MKTIVTVNSTIEVINIGNWSADTTLAQVMTQAKDSAIMKLDKILETSKDVKRVGSLEVSIHLIEKD